MPLSPDSKQPSTASNSECRADARHALILLLVQRTQARLEVAVVLQNLPMMHAIMEELLADLCRECPRCA